MGKWLAVAVVAVALIWLLWPAGPSADRADVDRGAPEAEFTTREERPPESEARRFVVRDLANGNTIPHLALRIGDETVRSDAAGIVSVGDVAPIELVEDDWVHDSHPRKDPFSTGEFWVHRWLRVEGVVRAEGGNLSAVSLSMFVNDESSSAGVASEEDRDRVVRRSRMEDKTIGEDGRFSVVVPRVHGIVLGASLKGWRPDTARLDRFLGEENAAVELVLTRAVRVSGNLVDHEDKAICFCGVGMVTVVPVAATDIARPGRLKHLSPDGAIRARGCNRTGGGVAMIGSGCRTNERGEFDIPITVDGARTYLICYAPGYRPVELDLGAIEGDREDLHVVAEPAPEGGSVRIVANGKPLADKSIQVLDLTFGDGNVQPGFTVSIDWRGNADTEWLVWGRAYWLSVRVLETGQSLDGCIVWKEQKEIDLVEDLLDYSDVIPDR